MKAPDKVFFPNDINLLTKLSLVIKQKDDVCYIRKDALLEWASRLKEKWEEPPMSKHSPGCVYMLEQLINKLNSM